ncbi:hypothetical protein [Methylobacterium segetis]|uniref:hypothetical protein n=1 Tax=Methylobacterium segetis TaxID=2488750 RepID=UPI0010442EF1|nr:hypothetical protein [Methylobacterium segetis]
MHANRSKPARSTLSVMTAAMLLLPAASAPVTAAPRSLQRAGAVTRDAAPGLSGPRWTGSLQAAGEPARSARPLRSSTLGNAEFPERDPIAQNLGSTAGGGSN